jgi:hypothetical protein
MRIVTFESNSLPPSRAKDDTILPLALSNTPFIAIMVILWLNIPDSW